MTVRFNLSTELKLLTSPQSVTCEIYSCKQLGDVLWGEAFIPVPDFGNLSQLKSSEWTGNNIDPRAIPGYTDRRYKGVLNFN